MKLKLEKQKLVSLSSNEMELTKAGGQKRSNNKDTDCRYSNEHSSTSYHEVTGGGCVEVTQCVSKDHPNY